MNKTLNIYYLLATSFLFLVSPAYAANLTPAYLRLDRMQASTATGGVVCARMTTNGSEGKIKVTFPTGFTVNGTASNWTVSNADLPTGATDWSGSVTSPASGVSGQTVTWTLANGDYTGSIHCFRFGSSNTLTTGTTGSDKSGTIQITTAADAEIDVAQYATAVIDNDQVVITATVPPTFSFALGTNTQALGTLSSTAITSGTGVTVTLGTNAPKGWLTWVKSLYTYLNSATASDTIPTIGSIDNIPSDLTTGAEGYVLDCNLTTDSGTAGTGTVTIDPEYAGDDVNNDAGGTLTTTFNEVASANGPTDSDVVTLIPRVTISALTKAATDYTDTLTVVGAANF
jgi:hypothetical protein